MKDAGRELVYLLTALVLVNLLTWGFHGLHQLPADALLHVIVSALAVAIAALVKVFAVRHELFELLAHHRRLDSSVSRPVLAFLRPKLRAHLEASRRLASDGMELEETELESLVAASFDACDRSYQGTDRHVPSQLSRLYPTYLRRQTDRKGLSLECDTRFLLVAPVELQQDLVANRQDVESFVDEHLNKGIMLLQVDPAVANAAAIKHRLISKDVGVFSWKFVVFYDPPSAGGTSFKVRVLPLTTELTERLADYFIDLNKVARRVEMDGNDLCIKVRRPDDIHAQRRRMFENRDWPPGFKRRTTG